MWQYPELHMSLTKNLMQVTMDDWGTWSKKMRASGAQSVVLMKRATSVTLHSSGLLSKHNFWGASLRGLCGGTSDTQSGGDQTEQWQEADFLLFASGKWA